MYNNVIFWFLDRPERYVLPPLIRIIGASLLSDNGVASTKYVSMTLGALVEASSRFHTRQSLAAVQSVQAIYDDVADVLWKIVEGERVIEHCLWEGNYNNNLFNSHEAENHKQKDIHRNINQ